MPVRIKPLPGGEFRGEQSATAEMNKSQRSKIENAIKKAAKAAAPSKATLSDQDVLNFLKRMMVPKKSAPRGGPKKSAPRGGPKKKMMHGGKVKKK